MSLEQVRKCDIYGTARDVKGVKLTLELLGEEGEPTVIECDMGPRARTRALNAMTRVMKKRGESEEG